MRRIVSLLAVVLLAAACSSDGTGEPIGELLGEPVDRLVILGDDGNVFTIGPDGADQIGLTADAGSGTGYFQPTWSPDGSRVAVGKFTGDQYALVIAAADGSEERVAPTAALPFYLFWDPAGGAVAFLSGGSAMSLGIVTTANDATTVRTVDGGAPYYFDWEPEGTRMIVNTSGNRLEYRDPDGDAAPLGPEPGSFNAPQWTPDGIVYAATTGGIGELVVAQEDEGADSVLEYSGFVQFELAAGGERLAYQVLSGDQQAAAVSFRQVPFAQSGRLMVLDLIAGTQQQVTGEPVAGFWWSPDGSRLLVLGIEEDGLRWRMWDGTSLEDLTRFRPTGTFVRDFLPFFDQYARSMSLWSPDGNAFVYPAVDAEGTPRIWVQRLDGGEPQSVAEGVWAAWSPR
jgi:TolB protein